ncbi:MAG: hypothetical protein ACJAWF_002765, partial [Candidatus Azotimanducaceae bacterium]
MNEAEIRALLAGGLIDCEIELTSEGNKLSLRL